MTAATVEETPPAIGNVFLETHPAIQLVAVLDELPVEQRGPAALAALEQRRADLGLYRTLLIERYGSAPSLERIYAGDQILGELTLVYSANASVAARP